MAWLGARQGCAAQQLAPRHLCEHHPCEHRVNDHSRGVKPAPTITGGDQEAHLKKKKDIKDLQKAKKATRESPAGTTAWGAACPCGCGVLQSQACQGRLEKQKMCVPWHAVGQHGRGLRFASREGAAASLALPAWLHRSHCGSLKRSTELGQNLPFSRCILCTWL